MTIQVKLTEAELRAVASLLSRVGNRLAAHEEQTLQEDTRHAEELQAVADDLLGRLEREKRTESGFGPLSLQDLGAD